MQVIPSDLPFLLAQFQKDQLMAGASSPLLAAPGISLIRQVIINIHQIIGSLEISVGIILPKGNTGGNSAKQKGEKSC